MRKLALLLIPALFLFQDSFGYHLMGTEIGYESLGQDNYKIKLKVYRDCSSPFAAQFDDPAFMAIYKANAWTVFQLLQIPFQGADSTFYHLCSPFPFSACTQSSEYNVTVNLPFLEGGYVVVYQRCCRNTILSNIENPGSNGATAWILIKDSALLENNTTPIYTNLGPTSVICLNQLYVYNYNYQDIDGDSIRFHFANSYVGADEITPQPTIPPPPPYQQLTYVSPYSYLQPLGPGSTVTLDSITGLLSILPTQIGVFEIGIMVSEFRNGILLSSSINDFEITVGEYNVGINDPLKSSFEVYPNPATENVFIHLSEDKPSKIFIYDELGRVIYSTELNQDIQLSTSNWTKGFYHVMLQQKDQSFFSSLVLQ